MHSKHGEGQEANERGEENDSGSVVTLTGDSPFAHPTHDGAGVEVAAW